MIRYAQDLCLTDKTGASLNRIKRRLYLGAGMTGLYVIMIATHPDDIFDIVPAAMFKSRKYRHFEHKVIGLAESRRKAYEMIGRIFIKHYYETGRYDGIKEAYLKRFSR
ncbi:MAG: hypothetical protein K6F34_10185 [Lachnospiraceae bacterium]|nr:hypothetical protein [Lachnospiraceae bacterium]